MSHIRTQIKDAIATILDAGTHASWYITNKTRITPKRQNWPFLMVYSTGDNCEVLSVLNPTIYRRTVNITIVGMIRLSGNGDTETVENTIDTMALDIETRMTNTALRAVIPAYESMALISTSSEVVVTEDDVIDHAELTMVYEVVCATDESSPAVLI